MRKAVKLFFQAEDIAPGLDILGVAHFMRAPMWLNTGWEILLTVDINKASIAVSCSGVKCPEPVSLAT